MQIAMELRTCSARGVAQRPSPTMARYTVGMPVRSMRSRSFSAQVLPASQAHAVSVAATTLCPGSTVQSCRAFAVTASQRRARNVRRIRGPVLQAQVADLETILAERDACGVGFIASLKNEKSHKVVEQALQALGCMEHRGACSADDDSGDGAGIMTQIPWDLFKKSLPSINESTTGVAMVFLPNDDALEAQANKIFDEVATREGFKVVGRRPVPIRAEVVGRFAKATQPRISQVFVEGKPGRTGDDLERDLFLLRRLIEKEKAAKMGAAAMDFYICTMSNRTIVYKGMLRSVVVGEFFKDLHDPDFQSSFAIYHRRFSTNTTPKWPLAQPFRFLGHNGEINTLQGNLNWVASREHTLSHPVWKGHEQELVPLCNAAMSDSSNLDNVAELMVQSGFEPAESLMVLVPEAYRNHPDLMKIYPEAEAFYEFWEGLQEGWDGPALIVFSDGHKVGARLDRNGLRPARFWTTSDDMIYVASEVGVLGDVMSNAANVVAKGRLGPGQMVIADLQAGTFMENADVSKSVAGLRPYKQWLEASLTRLGDLGEAPFVAEPVMDAATLIRMQAAAGMGAEDSQMVVEGMAQSGTEPTFCMGDDIPLPVLSNKPHLLFNYFKQRFAQVTNPPIDPLREGLVMSLEMRLGGRGNLLEPGADSYRQIMLNSPIIVEAELDLVLKSSLSTQQFKIFFETGKVGALEASLRKLCSTVEAAVAGGCSVVVLSDRVQEATPTSAPIPALLAVGAVHHHLIQTGLRSNTSIVIDTAQCYTVHHAAMLIGYGAHAICPYLGLESCRQWRLSSRTVALIKSGKVPDISVAQAQKNFKKSLEKGILKIISKMGISLLSCYHGAQIFEAYGLGPDVVNLAFKGSVSRIGGLSLNDVQRESEVFWTKGFPKKALTKLEDYGFIQSKPKGEYHANNQTMAKLLHKAIGLGEGSETDPEAYEAYQQHFEEAPVTTLRDCLEFLSDRKPIDIDEVEPAEAIMSRFCTGGMSLGAISRETHETIAVAINRIGGKSNSGEGGEDPMRWIKLDDVDEEGKSPTFAHLRGLSNGDTANSKIKQVASGRFGVTPQFLVNAEQLEIKIAQGAKPGEGGQLPGQKVSPYIASLRRSKPGVPLISPPPHHDIYSIEDLAQLIYDLHQVNPRAKVSVKLVAEAGIGVVASGVAKAGADVIQVSGHDGGTGASPISSIKHAGGPIEMGLSETHQTLVRNELRERVVLRADGGFRNGRDVLMAAAMGADEYGFGTVAMIATGCIMARVCHTNNCPVGVASQREELRARFPGAPADLVNFFHFVAEEVRQTLAQLGYKSLDDIIGRADLLRQRTITLHKTTGLDLSFLTTFPGPCGKSSVRLGAAVHDNGPQLDDEILEDAAVMDAIVNEKEVERSYEIVNVDRSSLGRVAGVIAKHHGDYGFAGSVKINLTGSAGQSFACFGIKGLHVKLVGEANDYVCKGMSGGEVVIVPPPASPFKPEECSIVGNTCLYGATGGRLFVHGRAGERFAVRNSMADAVVEGAGDHCCEYMTGGTVVCLGSAGRNVGAGMTGGLAYFFDEEGDFPEKVNAEIVAIQRVVTQAGEQQLRSLIEAHVEKTGSGKAKAVLASWETSFPMFWQLVPPAEKNTPEANKDIKVGAATGLTVAATA